MNENATRDELEREANDARERLLSTIELIDQRRHEMLDWKVQMHRHSGQLILAVGGLASGIGIAAGAAIYRAEKRDERLRQERWRALNRFWQHPERLAVRRERHPLRTAMRALFLTITAVALATVAARKMVQRQRQSHRIGVRFREAPRLR